MAHRLALNDPCETERCDMNDNQLIPNRLAVCQFPGQMVLENEVISEVVPDGFASNARIDVKGIRAAIARVEAGAKATVAW